MRLFTLKGVLDRSIARSGRDAQEMVPECPSDFETAMFPGRPGSTRHFLKHCWLWFNFICQHHEVVCLFYASSRIQLYNKLTRCSSFRIGYLRIPYFRLWTGSNNCRFKATGHLPMTAPGSCRNPSIASSLSTCRAMRVLIH